MASRISPYVDNTGLVFAYDLANVNRSYLGEPATNLAVSTWSSWGVDASGYSTVGTRTILSPYHVRIDDISSNTRQSFAFYSGFNASTTYNFSVKFKKITGAPTLRFQIYSYVSGNFTNVAFPTTVQLGLTDKEGWQTASYSYTSAAGSTGLFWYIQDGDDYTAYTHSFELKEIQLEVNSHATPFVVGTRSVTQGLKDLTGNSTIDLTNVSFDANAQMTFDGSDDRILTSENITLNGSQTFEVITTISGGPQSPAGIISNHDYANTSNFGLNHISSNRIGISIGYTDNTREYDSKYTTYAATIGTPFHLVMTFDQPSNTVKLYVNGALDSTFVLTKTVKFTNRPIVLGRWDYQYNYYYFNGKVPVAKVYNRALPASEIQQNFNAIKGRYGL